MIRVFLVLTILCVAIGRAQDDDDTTSGQNSPPTFPVDTVGKKGFCRVTSPGQEEELRDLKAAWFYSWGADIPRDVPSRIEFVPMIWGRIGPQQEDLLNDIRSEGHRHVIKALLGFNEPDNKTQSNMSVQDALDEWPMLMKTEVRLGSPAAMNADQWWMQDFMKQVDARHLRVDFITVHWYGWPSADGFLHMLDHVHQMYGRPIWITEFCPADWSAGPNKPAGFSKEQVQQFMQKVIPALLSCPYVERFAWFSDPKSPQLGNSALFDTDDHLTPLGEMYAGFGSSSGSSSDDPDDSMQQ